VKLILPWEERRARRTRAVELAVIALLGLGVLWGVLRCEAPAGVAPAGEVR
jgi:hypothetical protein